MSTGTTPPDAGGRLGLATFVVALGLGPLLLAIGIPLAQRHRDAEVDARRVERARVQQQSCAERGALFVPRVRGALPVTDSRAVAWDDAPELTVALQRQTVAMPMLETLTVDSARIQALTDGSNIAWRVRWRDGSQDASVDAARFTDALALQFAITPNANFTMGQRGQLVQILHWKALWQKDVDEHFQDVQDLHPNYWADLYWFAEGRPYRVPESFRDPRSHAWFAAYSAGNPMSDFHRVVPVEELAAEGYGTLTSQRQSISVGGGAWVDGEWSVVLARPMRSDDALDYQFWRGGHGTVGIAIWDGAAGNVGGRKHWSNWIDFEVSP